jgi:hypothetical protein
MSSQIYTDNINASTSAGLNIGYCSIQDVNILTIASPLGTTGNVNIGGGVNTRINLNVVFIIS